MAKSTPAEIAEQVNEFYATLTTNIAPKDRLDLTKEFIKNMANLLRDPDEQQPGAFFGNAPELQQPEQV